jgi:two-component system, OmpR family, sensor histidine kinase KdpD
MVLGASRRSRLVTLLAGKSTPTRLARRAEHIDVHLVSREGADRRRPALAWRLAALRSRRVRASRASAEAAALTRLAASVLRGRGDPPALLEEIRQMFGLAAVSLLERRQESGGSCCYIVASAGERPPEGPGADVELPVSQTFTLAGRGRVPGADDTRVLSACAAQVVAGITRRRQDEQDADAAQHAADLRSRSALLAATSQHAREQLAAAQAALAGLADHSAAATPGDRAALVAAARRAVDRIGRLITDLSDLSRLHAGTLEIYLRPVDLDEVIAASLEDLGPGGHHITLSTADLLDVIADAALLTRILTSLMADALHRSPPDVPPVLTAAGLAGHVEICITDHGPGPDQGNGMNNLALRLARDLTEAMGDTLRCQETHGGGRTVIITLPAAARRPPAPPAPKPAVPAPESAAS